MKALEYLPLALVAAAMFLGVLGWRWRVNRATRRARWEPYIEIVGDGRARVGTALVARWGRHEERLRCDADAEEFTVDDFLAVAEARTRASLRADAYNSATRQGAR